MNKKIIILVILAFLGIAKTNAFTVAFINGHVTNTLTNSPAVAHTVIITDSISYTQIHHTDINGYYHDSIGNSSPNPIKYYILIYDCNNILHYDTVTTSGFVLKTANFSICYNFIDAGVTDILTPTNPVMVGDIIPLKVKFKNYSTQTINSLQIAFKINGQLLTPMNWAGVLNPDSSAIIQIGNYTVQNQNNLYLVSYTNLTGDMYHNNDTCFKTQSIVPQFDAGVTLIINPIPSGTLIGDTIYPKIKFKNYGTQVITNIQLGYKVNGQLVTSENCTINLPHDSSAIYQFNHPTVCLSNPYYICAFTQLAGDNHIFNDTTCLTIIPSPALRDVGIVDIINPSNIVCVYSVIYPKVIIKNFGATPLTSIPVVYQRGTLSPVTATWTSSIPLQFGDTVSYTFTTPFTVPFGTSFSFSSYTLLANDANPLNNYLNRSIVIFNSNIPQTFSIEGDDTVIIGQSHVIYKASYFYSNFDQIIWTLPPGAVIDTAYQNYIVVNYGNNAQSGNITCKIMNACGISQTMVLPISVFVTPPPPIIYQSGNTLGSGYSTGNQWYFENTAIPGETHQIYTATQTGHYYCKVTINGNTSSQSNTIYVAFAGIEDEFIKSHFEVFPNPVNDVCNFKYALNKTSDIALKITDIEGRLVKQFINKEQQPGDYSYQMDAVNLTKGIYFYQFKAGNSIINGKLIIIK